MPEHPDFDTDTAISADLDGALDEFAAELNLDASELRALMTARPEYADRRNALELARGSLRAPVEPLDELTRARLLTGAGTAAVRDVAQSKPTSGARDRRWGARLAVAAAIAVVLLGGGVLLVNRGGSEENAKSASTASGSVRSGKLGDIGAIDESKLDKLIGGQPASPAAAAGRSTASTPTSGVGPSEQALSSAGTAVPDSAVAGFDARSGARATAEQLEKCEKEYATNGPLRFSATGAYLGRAAVVLGIANGERTIVFVLAADDCPTVLFSVSR